MKPHPGDEKTHKEAPVTIALVPSGTIETEVMTALKQGIRNAFGKEAVVPDPAEDPAYALDKERGQYLASSILKRLSGAVEYAGYERVLMVVDLDLYAANANFVFGEAAGRVAVVSIARLKESFYGLEDDTALFLKRAATEAVHELGHTYGLGHCYTAPCAMFFSNSIVDTDRKNPFFCRACAKRIASQ